MQNKIRPRRLPETEYAHANRRPPGRDTRRASVFRAAQTAPEGRPPRIAGVCAHKNEITCAWSKLHLVCQFGDMVAHCLDAVKHIVRFYAMTARIFGLFVLDRGVYVPYNFSQC